MENQAGAPFTPGGHARSIRALIVDDHALLLSMVRDYLDAQAFVRVVGTASNGSEALQKAKSLAPDLVLMDLQMPCMDGLQTTVLLRGLLPNTRIIIMTLEATIESRAAALAHGAHGFVPKTQLAATLTAEIRRVFHVNEFDAEGEQAHARCPP